MRRFVPAIVAAAFASSAGAAPLAGADSSGSAFFSLSSPRLSVEHGGTRVSGRVCRLAGTTLLSPEWVRVEHLVAGGGVSETARAEIPPIYKGPSCADYRVDVDWAFEPGDIVRACFDRGQPCPPPDRGR